MSRRRFRKPPPRPDDEVTPVRAQIGEVVRRLDDERAVRDRAHPLPCKDPRCRWHHEDAP